MLAPSRCSSRKPVASGAHTSLSKQLGWKFPPTFSLSQICLRGNFPLLRYLLPSTLKVPHDFQPCLSLLKHTSCQENTVFLKPSPQFVVWCYSTFSKYLISQLGLIPVPRILLCPVWSNWSQVLGEPDRQGCMWCKTQNSASMWNVIYQTPHAPHRKLHL